MWKLPRLRVGFADPEAGLPGDTQVLFRQRVGWVVLLGAFLAMLCLPAHRRIMLSQAEGAILHRGPEWIFTRDGGRHSARIQRSQQRFADDPRAQSGVLLTGAGPESGNPWGVTFNSSAGPSAQEAAAARLDYWRSLCKEFPADAAVRAHLLRYLCINTVLIRREDVSGMFGDKLPRGTQLLSADALAEVKQLAAEGERLEPENAYFGTLLAVAYFAASRDEAGMAEWERVSRLPEWHDHAIEEALGARRLTVDAYGDAGTWMHMAPMAAVLLPHCAQVRAASRVMLMHSQDARKRGDFETEHRLRAAVVRLGQVMRLRSDIMICRLVGRAIEQAGFVEDPAGLPHKGLKRDDTEDNRAAARAEYLARAWKQQPVTAAELQAEHRSLMRDPTTASIDEITKAWKGVLRTATAIDITGLTLMFYLAGALGVWLVSALVTARWSRSRRTWTALAGSGVACLAALGAGLFVFQAARSQVLVELWRGVSPAALLTEMQGAGGVHSDPLLPFTLLVIPLAGLVVALARRAPGDLFHATRAGARVLTGLLAVGYLSYLLAAVPLSARNYQDWERVTVQEMGEHALLR